jgi:predicted RNA-binding protein with RPS1 domain
MMANTENSSLALPEVENGIVERVLEYGAYLNLRDTGRRAYLHISRITDEFLSAPLTNHLSVGENLPIVVDGFDPKHNCWEVSHRAYQRLKRLEESGLRKGDTHVAKIHRASELGCTILLKGFTAYLTPSRMPWSSYRVLFESGRLAPEKEIEVTVYGWSRKADGLTAHLPCPDKTELMSEPRDARVILLRPRYVKKKSTFQNIIYATFGGQTLARIRTTELIDVEETFPVGSEIPIRAEKVNVYTGMIDASIAWERTRFATPQALSIGDVRRAIISQTGPNAAYCLIHDRVTGFIYKSSVIGPLSEPLNKYLYPGDIVEVRISGAPREARKAYPVDFLRTIEHLNKEQTSEEAALIDLAATRRLGRGGGFSRDASFRSNVLEAYDHRCCMCGVRYVIGDSSAMEAAHVIPRGNRGANLLQNALCLCPIHHWAFDRGFLAIDEERNVKVAALVLASGEEIDWLTTLDREPAHIPSNAAISPVSLAWHKRNLFLDD